MLFVAVKRREDSDIYTRYLSELGELTLKKAASRTPSLREL